MAYKYDSQKTSFSGILFIVCGIVLLALTAQVVIKVLFALLAIFLINEGLALLGKPTILEIIRRIFGHHYYRN
jgi:uncharacterized membrane protein HdeD (DUF308 family)